MTARLGLVLAVAGLLAGCRKGEFRIAGTITLAANLQHRTPQENSVLFIVAKNRGGVPIAVRRIVNPQFPVSFTLTSEDLIVPELRGREALRILVQMNTHGNVGAAVRGDLEGDHPDQVAPVSSGVHILVDRQL